jgi:hypothetical protein
VVRDEPWVPRIFAELTEGRKQRASQLLGRDGLKDLVCHEGRLLHGPVVRVVAVVHRRRPLLVLVGGFVVEPEEDRQPDGTQQTGRGSWPSPSVDLTRWAAPNVGLGPPGCRNSAPSRGTRRTQTDSNRFPPTKSRRRASAMRSRFARRPAARCRCHPSIRRCRPQGAHKQRSRPRTPRRSS